MTKYLKGIKKFKLLIPIHPFLFAVSPALFFFSKNKNQLLLDNSDFINSIILTLLITIGFWILVNILIRNWGKSGLLSSLSLMLFFSYGHVQGIVGEINYQLGGFAIGTDKVLLSVWGLIFTLAFYLLANTRIKLHQLSNLLTIIGIVLVVFSLFDIIYFELGTRKSINEIVTQSNSEEKIILKKPKNPPDIYYIIFDGFPRTDTFTEVYNYDNSGLTDYLMEKGFYVAKKSNSNYAATHFSLPSSLNMQYINFLTDELGINSRDTTIPKAMIENNKVVENLKSLDYTIVQLGSEYEPTSRNKNADINVTASNPSVKIGNFSYRLNEYSDIFLRTTILSPFINNILGEDVRSQRLFSLNKVPELTKIRGPKFVFAHLTISHPPPLFDENGDPLSESKLKEIKDVYTDKENNLNQLIFVSKAMKSMVDKLLSQSKNPPIIIIQSDHGSTALLGHPFKWKRPFNENISGIKERMGILNAYYLPKGGNKILYDSITPVNTFRLIFNYYFEANYKLLPDISYYSDNLNLYEFFDVTKDLK